MTPLVWVFALLAAGLHVLVFVWEALAFQRPAVHRRIFFTPTADVPAVRLWAFGVGFYNLLLACGTISGVVAWSGGNESVGRALVIYTCLFMALSGLVLFIADRMELGRPVAKAWAVHLARAFRPSLLSSPLHYEPAPAQL
jgi:putative membrane protein